MSHPFVVFSRATGEIVRTGLVAEPEDLASQNSPDQDWLMMEADDATQFVDVTTKQLRARPVLDVPSLVDLQVGEMFTSRVVPAGSVVSLSDGTEAIADEEGIEFAPVTPGVCLLRIRPPFPYRECKIRITVSD